MDRNNTVVLCEHQNKLTDSSNLDKRR